MSDTKNMDEQIAKLPKWARDHIDSLARQRAVAVKELDEYCNSQKQSPFFTEDMACTGESSGPSHRVRYIQAHTVCVVWRGVHLRIDAHGYGNRSDGISLSWGAGKCVTRDVAMIPQSYNSVRLVAKEDMT
jgi:hypothetical protein